MDISLTLGVAGEEGSFPVRSEDLTFTLGVREVAVVAGSVVGTSGSPFDVTPNKSLIGRNVQVRHESKSPNFY